jgi:phosphohistidine phosphatase
MKTLLLMRHAKSSWSDGSQADVDRPLNDRGRREAPRMGRWLRAQGLELDHVISSHARRAVETAEAVIDASGYGGEWQREPSLYAAGVEAYLDVLRGLPDTAQTVLVVAHNPGTEEVVEALTGEQETMKTACVAVVELPLERWQGLGNGTEGRLAQVGRPREITE